MKGLILSMLVGFICLVAAPGQTTAEETDAKAIEAAVRNYVEGWFSSDPDRMRKSLHPNLFKVTVRTLKGTSTEYLDIIETEGLVAYAAHNQDWVEGKSLNELRIVYQDDHFAVVHAVSTDFYDICGLVKIGGEWKILQVMWTMNES